MPPVQQRQRLVPRNDVERFMLENFQGMPGAENMIMTDQQLDEELASLFHDTDLGRVTPEVRREEWNRMLNERLAEQGGTFPIIGAGPKQGESVQIIDLPHSAFVARLSDGGMRDMRIYLLDFVDARSQAVVGAPQGYQILRLEGGPGSNPMETLITWEAATGFLRTRQVLPSEERFSVVEGVSYRVTYPNGIVDFTAPVRQRQQPNVHIAVPRHAVQR